MRVTGLAGLSPQDSPWSQESDRGEGFEPETSSYKVYPQSGRLDLNQRPLAPDPPEADHRATLATNYILSRGDWI